MQEGMIFMNLWMLHDLGPNLKNVSGSKSERSMQIHTKHSIRHALGFYSIGVYITLTL